MIDPEPYLEHLLEDEGLTSDLDEADAMALIAGLSKIIRANLGRLQAGAASKWVNDLGQRGRQVAQIVATLRERGPTEAMQLAQTHGFRWPTNTKQLVEQLLAQTATKD